MLQDEKYLEFKVLKWKDPLTKTEIEKMEPTDRGHVMINSRDAEVNNSQTKATWLHYEKAEKEVKSSDYRLKLEEKAKELNINFRQNIGDDKLLAKIIEIEPEFKAE
jgi:hypothetical protein